MTLEELTLGKPFACVLVIFEGKEDFTVQALTSSPDDPALTELACHMQDVIIKDAKADGCKVIPGKDVT